MDDITVYLIGGAIVVVFIIVWNHQKQKKKMSNFLQGSGDMQPIFLQKSVEKKIKALSTALYENGIRPDAPAANVDPRKQVLIQELEQLEKLYNAKKFTLRDYDDRLFELLEKANKLPSARPVNPAFN